MWWLIIGWMTGRGLRNAALPESVKQQRYDAAVARRQQRAAQGAPSVGQWIVLAVAALIVVGLIMQAFQ